MIKKLRLVLATLLLTASSSAFADTVLLTEANGWKKIKSISQTEVSDNYYVFVDNASDLMLSLENSAAQSNMALFYRTSVNPATDLSKVFTLEVNGGDYAMRNVATDYLQMQTEWSEDENDLRWRTNDQPSSVEWTGLGLTYSESDAAWTLTSTKYSRPLGIYNNTTGTPAIGNEIGANDSDKGQLFQIYAINKIDFAKLMFEGATEDSPKEGTKLILNSDFNNTAKTKDYGWTVPVKTGGNYNFNGAVEFYHYVPAFSFLQTLKVPNGKYRITLQLITNNATPNLFAIGTTTVKATSVQSSDGKNFSQWHTAIDENPSLGLISVDVDVIDNNLTIGLEDASSSGSWVVFDNFKLYCTHLFTAQELLAGQINQINDLITEATQYKTDTRLSTKAKNNVTTAITSAEKAKNADDATQESLDETISDLKNIISTSENFALVYPKALEQIATLDKIVNNSTTEDEVLRTNIKTAIENSAIPLDATATAEEVNSIISSFEASRQEYVVKSYPINDITFDMTFLLKNAAVSTETDWKNGRYNSGGQYTGAPDNRYLDAWNANFNMNQTVKLPRGIYTLTAATRAEANVTVGNIYINAKTNASKDIHHVGSSGNDLGNGWGWTTTPEAVVASEALIGFYSECGSNKWAGADDFRLTLVKDVPALDYSALETAIKETSIGFDKDEYAPYNNQEAMKTYNIAKVMLRDKAELTQDVINTAATNLKNATWTTKNTEEVNAIFDGSLDSYTDTDLISGQTDRCYAKGWSNPGDAAYNTRILGVQANNNVGLAASSTGRAIMMKYNTTYGEVEGYELPLNEETEYSFEMLFSGWNQGDPTRDLTILAPDGSVIDLSKKTIKINGTIKGESDVNQWRTYYGTFKTKEAGNYVLRFVGPSGQNQLVIADLKLFKKTPMTLSDKFTPVYAAAEGMDVNLTRTLKEGYNTIALPFDVASVATAFGGKATVYELNVANTTATSIAMTSTDVMKANVPYILKASGEIVNPTFTNVNVVAAADNAVTVEGLWEFHANYTPAFNMKGLFGVVENKVYEGAAGATLNGMRAYFKGIGGSNEAMIRFDENDGTTSIEAIESADAIVDVYSISGQLVKKAVKASEAAAGLNEGLYIIGGEKVYVK